MKTTRQYLESLPEPYRSEALENYELQNNADQKERDDNCPWGNSGNFLSNAFVWSKTKQGRKYWSELEFKIAKHKYNL